jgi:thioredoxin-related protein
MSMNRRNLLLGAAAAGVFAVLPARAEGPVLTADGLYKEPWFLDSFLNLADDLEDAHKAGKRFVISWELKGCPYCKETHLVNFAQARIADYIKANFEVLQLNIIGSLKVTDFDGEELPEKELARKYNVRFTPTFQFFAERAGPLKDLTPQKREVARTQGYLRPEDFLASFRFVRDKAYENGSFRDFLKSQPS